jgi:hypothetical protein
MTPSTEGTDTLITQAGIDQSFGHDRSAAVASADDEGI